MVALSVWLATLSCLACEPHQPVDFDTQIVPVFTRYGCNQGSCHGAAVGRGGFKLSLYGGNPQLDYRSVVQELGGRRVDLAHPARSLVLRKPTGDLDHEGDFRFDEDSQAGQLLRRWIAEGAKRVQRRQLVRFWVEPDSSVVTDVGATVQFHAFAEFDDTTKEEVTPWVAWTSADSSSVEIDVDTATATVLRHGRHLLIARYLSEVRPVEVILPWQIQPSIELHAEHPVDRFVNERLAQLALDVAPRCDDATFLRRLSLGLRGRVPRKAEVEAFLADEHPDKRARLVARWLDSSEFIDFWTYQLATWWRVRPPGRGNGRDVDAARAFHDWIRRSLAQGTGLDAMARELVTAEGDTHENGAATFYRLAAGPRELAEYFSETLMGVRLRCANCHNHPLDAWTQDDYHGLAALFAGIEAGRTVRDRGQGEVIHPRTGAPAIPKIPGGEFLNDVGDRREVLANWLVDPHNPYFARSLVNRTWAALMGRGLVEPVDDLRATNPATHPELLDWLTVEFQRHGHDLKWLVRTIVTSETYQRAAHSDSATNVDATFYSVFQTQPLPAEVLADAMIDVTGVPDCIDGVPAETRAIELVDVGLPSRSLDVLGRCDRESSCATAAPRVSGLAKTLHLLNGPLVNRVVQDERCWLQTRLKSGMDDESLLRASFLRVLGRPPSSAEQSAWLNRMEEDGSAADPAKRRQVWEDLWWALLCSREFTTNH